MSWAINTHWIPIAQSHFRWPYVRLHHGWSRLNAPRNSAVTQTAIRLRWTRSPMAWACPRSLCTVCAKGPNASDDSETCERRSLWVCFRRIHFLPASFAAVRTKSYLCSVALGERQREPSELMQYPQQHGKNGPLSLCVALRINSCIYLRCLLISSSIGSTGRL